MSVTVIILLVIILLLLCVVVALLVTGWPGWQRKELERLGANIRREMAEQRGDFLRILQNIRTDVEDAIGDAMSREGGYAGHRYRSAPPARVPDEPGPQNGTQTSERPVKRNVVKRCEAEQLSLFSVSSPAPVPTVDKPRKQVVPKEDADVPMERVQAVIHDDIPDIGDIKDID
ncbi:MAG TPA: hypothetical protein ENN50_03105 [Prosthecochloris aestuarii]|uniref:Uncharacterized protein n=1 Tax=Prosthecochloris aestuarii TaxID=1102 RepID=A0A831SRI9_PROAE|nr:hypothetical protein [Prosthecochloris aestuarii]